MNKNKKLFIYSDLSKKQLENLKEFYIQKKVESMSHKELKEYVKDIISHQINDTIDREEEMEAWREMSIFFGDQFKVVIQEIQTKYIDQENVLETEIDSQKHRIELLEKNNLDQEKKDMWDD
jgi:CO dehydrogenase/acetyl-CoA synthase beta subunit